MTVSFAEARTLLTPAVPDPVCYTLDDVERVFGVTHSPEQKAARQNIPFTEDVLKACAGTHMLFPGFPLSLLEIRAKHADVFSKMDCWYVNQPFAEDEPVRPSWHLLRMEPVPGSLGKSWDEQQKLLLPDEEVPSAALVAFATILHFEVMKQRLFERHYVRTSDVASGGRRVFVGVFDADGFLVGGDWDARRYGLLGVSSSRKF